MDILTTAPLAASCGDTDKHSHLQAHFFAHNIQEQSPPFLDFNSKIKPAWCELF